MDAQEKPLVLTIDDSKTIRLLLRQALEESDCRVEEADCAEKGIELFKQLHPNLIIMDVEMPGMGGVNGVASIRALPEGKYIPILMATSLDDLTSITNAFNAGATQFISKPINPNLIGHHVRYMLRSSQTEEELRKLSEELEQRVVQRTQQLQEANIALQKTLDTLKSTQTQLIEAEKMAALARIVARVAHEVNTPLGIGMTAISSLNERLTNIRKSYSENKITRTEFSDFLSFAQEILGLTESNLDRAAELIKNFKQVSADQTSDQQRVFALKDYLEKIIASLKPALRETQLKMKIDCPADLTLDSYPGVFFQVISTMVINSVTHGYEPNQPGTLSITVTTQGDMVTMVYADDGKGILPENLPHIFEPFFTTSRSEGGVGLGLHIAYNRVVQNLGGTIKCTSTPGQGAIFTIQFPKVSKPGIKTMV